MSPSRRSCVVFFFLMIRRPPRSTQSRSSAASDVYKRQAVDVLDDDDGVVDQDPDREAQRQRGEVVEGEPHDLSLIHISEPTRPY